MHKEKTALETRTWVIVRRLEGSQRQVQLDGCWAVWTWTWTREVAMQYRYRLPMVAGSQLDFLMP